MDFIFDENFIRKKLKDFDSPDRLAMSHEHFTNSAIVFLILQYKDKPYDLVLIRRTKVKKINIREKCHFPEENSTQCLINLI